MVGGGVVRLGALHCPQMAHVVTDSSRVKVTCSLPDLMLTEASLAGGGGGTDAGPEA